MCTINAFIVLCCIVAILTFVVGWWIFVASKCTVLSPEHGADRLTNGQTYHGVAKCFYMSDPLRVHSAVQRHQSAERPILHQISGLVYLKIQRRHDLHPSCARPPWWSPPVSGGCSKMGEGITNMDKTWEYD